MMVVQKQQQDCGGLAKARTTTTNVHTTNVQVFDVDDIKMGALIGQGGFCNIHELLKCDKLRFSTKKEQGQQQREQQNNDRVEDPDDEVVALVTNHPNRFVVKSPRIGANFEKALVDLEKEARILSLIQGHPNIIGLHAVDNKGWYLIIQRCEMTMIDKMNEWRKKIQQQRRCSKSLFLNYRRKVATMVTLKKKVGVSSSSSLSAAAEATEVSKNMISKEQLLACAELVQALDYLHSRNIMHRDVKPANIGFDTDGRVRLFDFGLAIMVDGAVETRYDRGCYKQTRLAGSFPYMAPEVVLGYPYGLSSDTFSMSLVMWEIMCLKEPFQDLKRGRRRHHPYFDMVIRDGYRPKVKDTWHPILKILLTDCWKEDPNSRPSMFHVSAHISRLCQDQGLQLPLWTE